MNRNYMIVEAPEGDCGFECRMLSGNEIEGLLRFRVRQTEEKREFYYEITSRQPLRRVLEQRKAAGEEIQKILLTVVALVSRIEEYLFKEEQLLLDPDYIYVDPDCFQVEFCLLPGHKGNWAEELSRLLEFLLERVDHQDRDGVVLAYNLYQESRKENYGTPDLMKYLLPGEDKIFKKMPSSAKEKEYLPERELLLQSRADEQEKSLEEGRYSAKAKEEEKEEAETEEKERAWKGREIKRGKTKIRSLLFLLAVMEAGLWYFLGRPGVTAYGGIAAAAVFLMFLLTQGRKKLPAGREKPPTGREKPPTGREKPPTGREKTPTGREKLSAGRKDAPEERTKAEEESSPWHLSVESEEEYRIRMEEKEELRMQKSQEEGTVLLGSSETSGIGLLEPMTRDEETIEIPYVPFVIGKHPDLTDYCLDRPTISRLHLRIDKKENVCIITDLNSTNGTTVNNYTLQANETVSIATGDVICLADIGYRFWEK